MKAPSENSESPFERKPGFSWREIAVIVTCAVGCATTWGATRSELNEVRNRQLSIEARQEKIEDALQKIPVIQTDIAWIKGTLLDIRNGQRHGE